MLTIIYCHEKELVLHEISPKIIDPGEARQRERGRHNGLAFFVAQASREFQIPVRVEMIHDSEDTVVC
jgi:hypothetical protein